MPFINVSLSSVLSVSAANNSFLIGAESTTLCVMALRYSCLLILLQSTHILTFCLRIMSSQMRVERPFPSRKESVVFIFFPSWAINFSWLVSLTNWFPNVLIHWCLHQNMPKACPYVMIQFAPLLPIVAALRCSICHANVVWMSFYLTRLCPLFGLSIHYPILDGGIFR